jgi:hypothetical protein
MFAIAMPRRPRPDSTLVLLLAIAIASGIAFFSVLSNVHASERQPVTCDQVITIQALTTTIDAFAEIAGAAGAGLLGGLLGAFACSWGLRRYAVVGLRARRQAAAMQNAARSAIDYHVRMAAQRVYR